MTTPGGLAWPDLLDALEERNRRFRELVRTGGGDSVPEVDLQAAGPLPRDLELRARLVLDETERLAELAARRSDEARLALRYAQA